VALSFGARIEGVTVYDAIGGSLGFRRPGYTIPLEPAGSWPGKKNSISLNVPIAVYRNPASGARRKSRWACLAATRRLRISRS